MFLACCCSTASVRISVPPHPSVLQVSIYLSPQDGPGVWTNCSVCFMKSLGISYIIWLQSKIASSLCSKIRWCYCLLPEFMMMWFQNSFNLVLWLSTSSGEQGALTLCASVSSRVDPVWVLQDCYRNQTFLAEGHRNIHYQMYPT